MLGRWFKVCDKNIAGVCRSLVENSVLYYMEDFLVEYCQPDGSGRSKPYWYQKRIPKTNTIFMFSLKFTLLAYNF